MGEGVSADCLSGDSWGVILQTPNLWSPSITGFRKKGKQLLMETLLCTQRHGQEDDHAPLLFIPHLNSDFLSCPTSAVTPNPSLCLQWLSSQFILHSNPKIIIYSRIQQCQLGILNSFLQPREWNPNASARHLIWPQPTIQIHVPINQPKQKYAQVYISSNPCLST